MSMGHTGAPGLDLLLVVGAILLGVLLSPIGIGCFVWALVRGVWA